MKTRTMTKATIESLGIIENFQEVNRLTSLEFPFDPVPASRPRVSKWGTYYGKTYKAWKEHAERYVAHGSLRLDVAARLLVMIQAVVRRPKTSKLVTPRGDIDNYAKGPLDVITKAGGYWVDDCQVVCLIASKRFADKDEQPRTEVHIYTCD